jgi:CxxC motif-containing protein
MSCSFSITLVILIGCVYICTYSSHGDALRYAAEELQVDKEVVLQAVRQKGGALKYASDKMKADKEIVLVACAQKGGALKYATPELKKDKEVVLEAVCQNGYALQYASDDLLNDKEVVMAAVKQTGEALQFASDELKGDMDIVLQAVARNREALYYSSGLLKYGGLKGHIDELMLTHESFYHALFGMKRQRISIPVDDNGIDSGGSGSSSGGLPTFLQEGQLMKWAKMEPKGLSLLSKHGKHNAYLIKVLIADFLGSPRGEHWTTVISAAKNLNMF